MHKKLITLILILSFYFSFFAPPASPEESPRLGVWITVFSEENILHSKKNVDHFLEVCSKSGAQNSKAYYNLHLFATGRVVLTVYTGLRD